MTLLQPNYAEDLLYPAYQDRLLMKGVVQAGVVNPTDFKVSAGSGLQVNVEKGLAFVAQTEAKQESGNTFYNGLYEAASTAIASPSNTVVVNGSKPTICQIILRIYDINELAISGSSTVKLEWLNGTPTTGATLTNRNGAAALPVSSLRLADVLVPAAAGSSGEYTIRDRRSWARGAYRAVTVGAGSHGANFGKSNAVVDTGLVSERLEILLPEVEVIVAHGVGSDTVGEIMASFICIDGVTFVGGVQKGSAGESNYFTLSYSGTGTVTAGSHLFTLRATVAGTANANTEGVRVIFREVISANNGTS